MPALICMIQLLNPLTFSSVITDKMKYLLLKSITGSILLAGIYSCNAGRSKAVYPSASSDSIQTINTTNTEKGQSLLHNGDLITRSDDDFESLSLQNFSKKDRTYSHSGMAFNEDNKWFIYHCIAGQENSGGHIKRELFNSFINPVKKTGFGIYRYQLSPTEMIKLHRLYKTYFAEKLPFDKSFNLQSDDSMYCSEIIFKSLKKVTNNRVILPHSLITNFKPKATAMRFKSAFFKKFDYVGIDDLYINSFCTKIFSARFQ